MDHRVQAAINFMNTNFNRKFSASEIARAAGISSSRLRHLFKHEVGKSLTGFRRELQFREAKRLLETTDMSVKEIAGLVGINTVSHFVKDFEKSYCLTTGDYTIVFTFASPLTSVTGANVASGSGSVATSNIDPNDAHNYIVNLTGVTNAQTTTVSLTNVSDLAGNFSSAISGSMGVLLGDVNGSRRVDAADVSAVRQQTLQTIDATNFRDDVNATGRIDAADVSLVRQQTLTSLP
jgi:AraC-like DNA-binding protein